MKKVSYDKYEEYSATFEAGFNHLEEQLKRREAMALKLADLLNEKIDECEALKEEVKTLREYADALNARLSVESPLADHVDTTGGEWAWEKYGPAKWDL